MGACRRKGIFRLAAVFVFVLGMLFLIADPAQAVGNYGSNTNSVAYSTNNPFRNFKGQCTWYAWGRALEKTGVKLSHRGHAKTWISGSTSTPRANSVAVWTNGTYGHVAFVETVKDGKIYISEYNRGSNRKYSEGYIRLSDGYYVPTYNGQTGAYKCGVPNGYLYCGKVGGGPKLSGKKQVSVTKGYYILQYAGNTRYLDVDSTSKKDCANIWIWNPNDSGAQVFAIGRNSANTGYNIQNVVSGKNLDTAGNLSGAGHNVIQYKGNGVKGQQWIMEDAGGGYVYIRNLYGYYLDVVNGVNANGTNVRVWGYNGSNAQKWKLIRVSGKPKTVTKGQYRVQSAIGGKYLDVYAGKTNNGNNVQLYNRSDNSDSQRFYIDRNKANSAHNIIYRKAGKFLDTDTNRTGKQNVILWPGNGVFGQQWVIEDAGNGYVYIRNLYGYYLDVVGGVNANGTNVQVYPYNGSNAQKWKLIPTYNVAYNPNSGEGTMQSITVDLTSNGSNFSAVSKFTRKGYRQIGWKVEKKSNGKSYFIVQSGNGWAWKENTKVDERKIYYNTTHFYFGKNDIASGDTIQLFPTWQKVEEENTKEPVTNSEANTSKSSVKKDQPMIVKATTKLVKVKALKKKTQTVTPISIKKAQGKVTYKLVSGDAKSKKVLKLNKKTGKVTVKKGTKKGTYKLKVKVLSAGTKEHKAGDKTVTITVRAK